MVVKYRGKNKSTIKARLLNFGRESRSDLIFFIGMFCSIQVDLTLSTIIQDPAQLRSGLPV